MDAPASATTLLSADFQASAVSSLDFVELSEYTNNACLQRYEEGSPPVSLQSAE